MTSNTVSSYIVTAGVVVAGLVIFSVMVSLMDMLSQTRRTCDAANRPDFLTPIVIAMNICQAYILWELTKTVNSIQAQLTRMVPAPTQ